LKLANLEACFRAETVRPRTGARIETRNDLPAVRDWVPFAPVRGRGLKHRALLTAILQLKFAPVRGRGLKPPQYAPPGARGHRSPPYGGAD